MDPGPVTGAPAEGSAVDGRTARGERTRRQLAESLIALLEEGVDDPTAREVAAKAGVSLRLVFHHFNDMEELLRTAVAVQVERHWSRMRPVDPTLPVVERVSQVVQQRESLFEAISPVRRAAARVEPGSPTVSERLDAARRALRRGVQEAFASELSGAGRNRPEMLDALESAASWETWDQLRRRMGLRPAAARRVMTRTLLALLSNTNRAGGS
jgi:AcrR family transcriptional regulator